MNCCIYELTTGIDVVSFDKIIVERAGRFLIKESLIDTLFDIGHLLEWQVKQSGNIARTEIQAGKDANV